MDSPFINCLLFQGLRVYGCSQVVSKSLGCNFLMKTLSRECQWQGLERRRMPVLLNISLKIHGKSRNVMRCNLNF